MASGRVKWFGPKKGHGFIRDDESGEDVFAHFSSMGGSGFRALEEGKAVLFDMVEGDKGLQARNGVRTGPYNITAQNSKKPRKHCFPGLDFSPKVSQWTPPS